MACSDSTSALVCRSPMLDFSSVSKAWPKYFLTISPPARTASISTSIFVFIYLSYTLSRLLAAVSLAYEDETECGCLFLSATMNVMTPENKKDVRLETAQNWGAFGIMVIGIAFGVRVPAWPGGAYILGAGVIVSLYLILRRMLTKSPKKISVLTIIAVLCWLYLPLSYVILRFFPSIFSLLYGDELQGFANWVMSLLFAGTIGIVFTSIELFRTSKK
jgi:hypothetical protein